MNPLTKEVDQLRVANHELGMAFSSFLRQKINDGGAFGMIAFDDLCIVFDLCERERWEAAVRRGLEAI